MPLYEYVCTQCGKHTEKMQKFSDAEISVCPHCGGKLERVITAPAVQFKGGGWFADGYGSKKTGGSNESKSGESSGGTSISAAASESGAPASTESKIAATTAPAAPAPSTDKK